MNASDIVKAKQSKTLYNAYYSPFLSTFISSGTTLNSCIISSFSYSTLNVVSSSVMDRGGGLFISTLEYVSCNNTVYPYQCGPNFISYEMQNAVKGEKKPSSLRWSNNTNTTVYGYNTTYSTLANGSSIASTISVTSTLVPSGTAPFIVPLVSYYQGTDFSNRCVVCTSLIPGDCCTTCNSG